MDGWKDVSAPIVSGLTGWPGDPATVVRRFLSIAEGESCNVSELSMSAHAGTHVDAPLHYVDGGIDVSHIPFHSLIGPARVIAIPGVRRIGAREVLQHCPQPGERLLIKTDNSLRDWWRLPFDADFCHLTPEGATELACAGVRTVGIDGLSIGGGGPEGDAVHRVLLTAAVTIIEGLALNDAPWGRCELVCLPLRVDGADGAPARAIIRPL